MANQPRKRTGGPVRSGQPVAMIDGEEIVPLVKEPPSAPPAEPQYDTLTVLVDGGNYLLYGPVPRKPVRVDGALFTWWQTGGCPYAEVADTMDVTLRLTNISLELAHTDILSDWGVVLTPVRHVWRADAAWLQGSDGSETAVPRG